MVYPKFASHYEINALLRQSNQRWQLTNVNSGFSCGWGIDRRDGSGVYRGVRGGEAEYGPEW